MTSKNLLVELFVEELPPKALKKLGEAFSSVLADSLKAQGLAGADAVVTHFASPRRLAVHVTAVAAQAANKAVSQKLMPVAVGLDASGNATPALLKKLQALGADASAVAGLKRAPDGKAEALFYDSNVKGATLAEGLQKALLEAIAKLPIPKVMTYQLESGCELPGWSSVSFVRPAHSLIALHGSDVVPVQALGLNSGNSTQGHRFEAAVSPVVIKDADAYAATLTKDGSVIASFAERRAEIVRQLAAAAAKVGGGCKPIDDDALLDEVTALVERPNVLICEFEKEFLEVPQECLILTMKANQKYFPLLDAANKLTNKFLVVSNISPEDTSFVIGGNERVVRPRLADAKFFFDQDRKKTLASRVEGLGKVVYHNKLGTQGERVQRVRAIAQGISHQLRDLALLAQADTAAQLAKTDLVTDMVGEFPELQGIMGGYYALNDGLPEAVAHAIEDHYKPRFAGDALPRNDVGVVVALADKLETLVGMFGIGNLPTGDKDPFALRRHALGIIRMLVEKDLPLELNELVGMAFSKFDMATQLGFDDEIAPTKTTMVKGDVIAFDGAAGAALSDFIYDRLAGSLREQGYSAQEVDAVLALRPQRLGDVPKRLAAVRAFAELPEAPALAAANKRVGNILKKAEAEAQAEVLVNTNPGLLKEAPEKALHAALESVGREATFEFNDGNYAKSLQLLAALKAPVDAFFDGVMVNAEDPALKANRLSLLKSLYKTMNRVADLSKLAT
ncbi:glycine--tRNA ligase subunit beta [Rhodoferax saidenbachensis]|uniref:Glycine--tRNA ligase beta subunit n=1 Tax=Rhodoferax saidenbachensis TaxID=1484693 RepID=A0A1P8K6U7_9BURK|nr:glycine--tRNA ligase subunit beta [Rhodoferax saidenbachensis]APW41651.1 glycine--tRNA ligase subunit beta [Rhodoferax saidenbachensis]